MSDDTIKHHFEGVYKLGKEHAMTEYNQGKDHGIQQAILQTKIHIVRWLLLDGAYKHADDIAKHILALSTDDILEIKSPEKSGALQTPEQYSKSSQWLPPLPPSDQLVMERKNEE